MPENYFFEDAKKEILKVELIEKKAKEKGHLFANKKLTRAQIRRFFHDVKSLQAKVEAQSFEVVKPLIKMLKSKVAYASRAGGQQSIPKEFKDFINECVDNINEKKDFDAFCLYFEAVLGFYYEESRR